MRISAACFNITCTVSIKHNDASKNVGFSTKLCICLITNKCILLVVFVEKKNLNLFHLSVFHICLGNAKYCYGKTMRETHSTSVNCIIILLFILKCCLLQYLFFQYWILTFPTEIIFFENQLPLLLFISKHNFNANMPGVLPMEC